MRKKCTFVPIPKAPSGVIGFKIIAMVHKKSIYRVLLLLPVALSLAACNGADNAEAGKSVEAIRVDGAASNAELVRNPVSAQGMDTSQMAKIEFEETYFDFGFVDEGAEVVHEFKFTNTGNIPLIISDARSTCGCTVPEWPRTPIQPGEGSSITVKFNTANKPGVQQKPITITANSFPSQIQIFLRGEVNPKPGTKKNH